MADAVTLMGFLCLFVFVFFIVPYVRTRTEAACAPGDVTRCPALPRRVGLVTTTITTLDKYYYYMYVTVSHQPSDRTPPPPNTRQPPSKHPNLTDLGNPRPPSLPPLHSASS